MLELRFYMQIPAENIIILVVSITVIFLMGGGFIILFVNIYNNRKKAHKKEKELLISLYSQTLLQSKVEIQEQTLQYISRELHDNLGITASLIKIHINTLKLDDPIKLVEQLEEMKDQVKQLIADIKELSVKMDGEKVGHAGLIRSLETEINRINKTGKLKIVFDKKDIINQLAPDRSIILFRMTQEILNNAVKHSEAKKIEITVTTSEKSLILEISDDGIGFNVAEKKKSGGSGLLNLYSRANLIQASLNIQSTPGSGTIISIALPLS